MTGPALDADVAAAMRAALAERVSATGPAALTGTTTRPWRRTLLAASVGLGLAVAGGGAAVAAGLAPNPFGAWLPGASRDVPLAPGVVTAQKGPVSIATTGAPEGTSGVGVVVTCVDAGTITWPGGATTTCDGTPGESAASQVVDLPAGGAPLVFTAPPGVRWGLQLTWVSRTPTAWGVNARGETYGVARPDGSEPDLTAVVATDGTEGYARRSDLDAARGPLPRTPEEAARSIQLPERTVQVPVYASDGTTVVGTFDVVTRAAP